MQAMQMRVLRRIEGVNKVDRVRNEVIRERLGQEGILDLVKRRQEKWLMRLQEMKNDRTRREEDHREDRWLNNLKYLTTWHSIRCMLYVYIY